MSCSGSSYLSLVFDVKPLNSSSVQTEASDRPNQLVFEDENCKVQYYLWGPGGVSSFKFTNKTEKTIVLDLSRSFVTSEGVSKDVYQARTWNVNGVSWTEQPKSIVAPKMTKEITGRSVFTINPLKVRDSNGRYIVAGNNMNYTYTPEDSPIKFSNSIFYYFNDAPQNKELVTHEFYVSACNSYKITYEWGMPSPSESQLELDIEAKVSDNDTNTRFYWTKQVY